MWVFKLLDVVKRSSQTSHSYGFSFVCVRMCVAKCDGVVHILPQTPHSCCPLFLFAAFFVAVVISFRIISSCISTSPTTSTPTQEEESSNTTPLVLLSLPSKPSSHFPLFSDVDFSFVLPLLLLVLSLEEELINEFLCVRRIMKEFLIFLQLSVLEKELSLLLSQI